VVKAEPRKPANKILDHIPLSPFRTKGVDMPSRAATGGKSLFIDGYRELSTLIPTFSLQREKELRDKNFIV
jgi:hypothetical protein